MSLTVDAEFFRRILEQTEKKNVRHRITLNCQLCGNLLDNGYCRNDRCRADELIEVFACNYCGYCPNPGHCPQAVTCPVCYQSGTNLCITPTGAATGFHEERWDLARNKDKITIC